MNVTIADFTSDGVPEIYVSNVHAPLQAEGSLLWTLRPRGGAFVPEFCDEASRLGVLNERRFGWGAAAGDLDRDGDLDLAQVNGMVDDTLDRRFSDCPSYWYVNEKVMRAGPELHTYADRWGDLRGRCIFGSQRNRVYLNRGPTARPRFLDVAEQVGWDRPGNARGIALADLDNDGDLDGVVTHMFSSPTLYRNTLISGPTTHWVGLELCGDGRACSREAVGARVTVVSGKDRWVPEQQLANGFAAQGDRRLLFGLGERGTAVDVEIQWPGSPAAPRITRVRLAPDRYHRVRFPAVTGATPPVPAVGHAATPPRSTPPGKLPGPASPGR
ncbi:MAG: hypothetical protein FJX77_14665 [Armatimonadetes bacterium]|nr:hypothetical protein [Armatimonadota bacterium]